MISYIKLYRLKLRLYLKKKFNNKEIDDLLEEEENLTDQYYRAKEKKNIFLMASIISKLTCITEALLGFYAMTCDNQLKYHISSYATNGIRPIRNDFNNELYIYLFTTMAVFNILSHKTYELSDIYWNKQNLFENKMLEYKKTNLFNNIKE